MGWYYVKQAITCEIFNIFESDLLIQLRRENLFYNIFLSSSERIVCYALYLLILKYWGGTFSKFWWKHSCGQFNTRNKWSWNKKNTIDEDHYRGTSWSNHHETWPEFVHRYNYYPTQDCYKNSLFVHRYNIITLLRIATKILLIYLRYPQDWWGRKLLRR